MLFFYVVDTCSCFKERSYRKLETKKIVTQRNENKRIKRDNGEAEKKRRWTHKSEAKILKNKEICFSFFIHFNLFFLQNMRERVSQPSCFIKIR